MIGLWFLHSALPLIALYHCIKFHLFIFNTFRDMLQTSLLLQKIRKGNNSVKACDIVQVLDYALPLMAIYQYIKFHLIPFITFRDMLRTNFLLQKIKKGSNSVNTGDRVMVLAFCNSPHGPLSVYQVSFNYLQFWELCSGQKWRTDTRTDGQTDWQSAKYILSLQGA